MPFQSNHDNDNGNNNQQLHQHNNDVSDSGQSFMSSSSSSSDGNSIDSLEEQSAVQQSAQNIVDQALSESLLQSTQAIGLVNGIIESEKEILDEEGDINSKSDLQRSESRDQAALTEKETAMQRPEVEQSTPTLSATEKEPEINTSSSNYQTRDTKVDSKHQEPELEPDSLSSVENNAHTGNIENTKPLGKSTLKQVNNNNNNIDEDQLGGLNLNMTASEMRELLSRRKKFDPKKAQMNIRQKYEIIQQM